MKLLVFNYLHVRFSWFRTHCSGGGPSETIGSSHNGSHSAAIQGFSQCISSSIALQKKYILEENSSGFLMLKICTWCESVNELMACPRTECVLMVKPWQSRVALTPNNLATECNSSLPMTSTSKASSPTRGMNLTLPSRRIADKTRITSMNGIPRMASELRQASNLSASSISSCLVSPIFK